MRFNFFDIVEFEIQWQAVAAICLAIAAVNIAQIIK